MPSIFISGIPKGLDRERTAWLIKRDIERVAQVRTIWIHKEKGCGFVSLHDEASADFVLSLNEKICINGNTLRITRWKRKQTLPKPPRETIVPTCTLRTHTDAYVLRGYGTYTNYKCHRPQSEALYQYIQQTPKQKKLKRKPWKDSIRLSKVPSPKSRKNVREKRQKCKKKNSRHTNKKKSTSSSREGPNFVSKRHKRRNNIVLESDVDTLPNVPTCISRKASTLKDNWKSNTERENSNGNLEFSIHKRPTATVHVYDHSKRLFSIEIDNNNVFESIQSGLKCIQLPSDDMILISHNGKTVSNQWQPNMADDDNIHIVVKGKGGMMSGDPPDKDDDGNKKRKIRKNESNDEGVKNSGATGSSADESLPKETDDGERKSETSTHQVLPVSQVDQSTLSALSSQLAKGNLPLREEPALDYDKLAAAILNQLHLRMMPTPVTTVLEEVQVPPVERHLDRENKPIPSETDEKCISKAPNATAEVIPKEEHHYVMGLQITRQCQGDDITNEQKQLGVHDETDRTLHDDNGESNDDESGLIAEENNYQTDLSQQISGNETDRKYGDYNGKESTGDSGSTANEKEKETGLKQQMQGIEVDRKSDDGKGESNDGDCGLTTRKDNDQTELKQRIVGDDTDRTLDDDNGKSNGDESGLIAGENNDQTELKQRGVHDEADRKLDDGNGKSKDDESGLIAEENNYQTDLSQQISGNETDRQNGDYNEKESTGDSGSTANEKEKETGLKQQMQGIEVDRKSDDGKGESHDGDCGLTTRKDNDQTELKQRIVGDDTDRTLDDDNGKSNGDESGLIAGENNDQTELKQRGVHDEADRKLDDGNGKSKDDESGLIAEENNYQTDLSQQISGNETDRQNGDYNEKESTGDSGSTANEKEKETGLKQQMQGIEVDRKSDDGKGESHDGDCGLTTRKDNDQTELKQRIVGDDTDRTLDDDNGKSNGDESGLIAGENNDQTELKQRGVHDEADRKLDDGNGKSKDDESGLIAEENNYQTDLSQQISGNETDRKYGDYNGKESTGDSGFTANEKEKETELKQQMPGIETDRKSDDDKDISNDGDSGLTAGKDNDQTELKQEILGDGTERKNGDDKGKASKGDSGSTANKSEKETELKQQMPGTEADRKSDDGKGKSYDGDFGLTARKDNDQTELKQRGVHDETDRTLDDDNRESNGDESGLIAGENNNQTELKQISGNETDVNNDDKEKAISADLGSTAKERKTEKEPKQQPPGIEGDRKLDGYKPKSNDGDSGSTAEKDNDPTDYQAKLIGELNLSSYFPDKLTYTSVMCISRCEKDVAETLADIPRLMLRKLIMLDSTSREYDLNICLTKMKRLRDEQSVKSLESNPFISDEDFLSVLANDEHIQENDSSNENSRNPVDVFLSIFICLHPTLKQKICLKMFACHLAIPIIFPVRKDKHQNKVLMFSMWPLRSITVHDGKTDTSLVNCKQTILSFIRLGRPQISKSKLANEILYDTAHDTFFNHDCTLGSSEKQASVGLVEAAWFLPSPKQPKKLQTVTLFLNLRGDAFNSEEQVKYLKKVSRVMIIVTDTKAMKNQAQLERFKQPHFNVLFFITGKISKDAIRLCKQIYMRSIPEGFLAEFIQGSKHGKSVGMSEVKETILNFIGPLLVDPHSTKTVHALCEQARAMGLTVDEDSLVYKNERIAANTLFNKVKDCHLADIKVKYTPLQTGNWQKYTGVMKSHCKSDSQLKEKDDLEKNMNFQRTEQWNAFKNGNTFIKDFIDRFLTLDKDNLVCFLESLKFEFDEKSRREMPNYRKRYADAWKEFQSKAEADKSHAKQLVIKTEQNLSKASFGIEHIFRELGQIYEASLMTTEHEVGSRLAKGVARSIELGYPFELMDGDVANIPLKWVKRVFKELKELLGDKRLLTLSILGLQSSGKSTLLNAMFGLTFSVSAGRCTRGIYLQLLPVKPKQFQFDYVLVVDTEGLRAPELGDQKYQHDNELATLVLGMADITIVNIKGENTSEVKDILQICVHAFLRLKMANQDLKLRQSCIFIHQNVSDVAAKDYMMHARKKLDETLDKMTQEAAEEENISDIKYFKDVINFDSNHHVWYFSDLWKGDPPMAPANPGYSRDVREVKLFIFRTLTQNKDSYLTISDTFAHIRDLWKGILANDFVFSFRNSLEIRAYNALEIVYQDLIWKLEQFIKELTCKAVIEMKQFTSECETEIDKSHFIPQHASHIQNSYQKKLQEKQSELKGLLENYFENVDKKDEIAKWKHGKFFSWDRFVEKCCVVLKKHLADIETHCRVDYEMNTALEKSKKEIYDQAAALAEHLKGKKPSPKKMDATFNEMWDEWIRKFHVQEEDSLDIKVELETIIFETFKQHGDVVKTELRKYPLDLHASSTTLENRLNCFKYDKNNISVKTTLKEFLKLSSKPDTSNKVIEFSNIILRDMEVKFRDLAKTEWKFDVTEMKTILKRILEHVDRHNDDTNSKYTFLETYKVKLCAHVFRFALPLLRNLDSEYRKKYSITTKLNNHKIRVRGHFQDIVDEKSATLIACDRFCEIIRDQVEEKIKRSLPELIYTHIVRDFACVKCALMNRIMKDLVKMNILKKFIAYIANPETYAFEWLSKYIDDKCFGVSGNIYMETVSSELQSTLEVIKNSLKETTASNLHDWLRNVQSRIKDTVWIQKESFLVVENQNITDLIDFIKTVKKELEQVRIELEDKFQREAKQPIKWYNNKTPCQKTMEKLWGCKAICPFCHEPCQYNNEHTGDHSCIQHRANGVSGWHNSNTKKLVSENCSFKIQTNEKFKYRFRKSEDKERHYYKDYKTHFPNWKIHPSPETSSSKYWAWFLCTHNEEIAEYHELEKADIPESWKALTADDAVRSLDTTDD